MTAVLKGVVVCLCGAVLGAVLKRNSGAWALAVALSVIAVVGAMLLDTAASIFTMLYTLMEQTGVSGTLFRPLIKTVALALVSRLGSSLCRDAGESAMATLVEVGGAFGAIAVSLPLFTAVWDMLQTL